MITAEIAGYAFNTELFCPDCIHVWAVASLEREGYNPEKPLTGWTTEGLLNALASLWDVDREYADSNDFPVPFNGQTAEHDKGWALHEGNNIPTCDGHKCGNDFTGEF